MKRICAKCGNEITKTLNFCNMCGAKMPENLIEFQAYSFEYNVAEIKILNIIKKELEEKHPEYKYSIAKTCESYSTLFFNDLGMIRLEKLLMAIDIWFRLTDETRDKYRNTKKFHWYNEDDEFWGICTRETDLSIFDEFIEDVVKNYAEIERITEENRIKREEKEKRKREKEEGK